MNLLKSNTNNLLSIWKQVFGNWKYAVLAISIMASFYILNVFINEFQSITQFYGRFGFTKGSAFFWSLTLGFHETILFNSVITLWIITLLIGLLFSLITYRTMMIRSTIGKNGAGFIGITGIFLGIIAPGCAACGIGLLSLLGISAAAISFLPYDGLEISWLAIGILGFSVFKISKEIRKGIACEVPKKHNFYKNWSSSK